MTQENHIELKQESNIGFAQENSTDLKTENRIELAQENSIVFKNVTKAYGKNVVIKDLNLEIKKGERLILLGPSGCGKTTTLRMIAGFEEISGGEIYLNGKVVNDLPPGERNIAMVSRAMPCFPTFRSGIILPSVCSCRNYPKKKLPGGPTRPCRFCI